MLHVGCEVLADRRVQDFSETFGPEVASESLGRDCICQQTMHCCFAFCHVETALELLEIMAVTVCNLRWLLASVHHHRLRSAMPGLRVPFAQALAHLRKFCKSRDAELERGPEVFYVVPGCPWKSDIISSDALAAVGRTCLRTFLTCGSFVQKQAPHSVRYQCRKCQKLGVASRKLNSSDTLPGGCVVAGGC